MPFFSVKDKFLYLKHKTELVKQKVKVDSVAVIAAGLLIRICVFFEETSSFYGNP
ncbi:hypothetical protein JCM19300_4200 [Algibacter lectus]|uniref:Uncharacterized protein n=1 Tax=Algibacter lectus TaxID=221126 RepID=A0A090VCX6_9FLAO|nr:hypothetical protein JCM19300_4200 [Algibacter lectus]